MKRGPKINNIKLEFTTRDSLGIESVSANIQNDLCPIINTQTGRAFYWAFMVWLFYDYYENSKLKIGKKEFNDYVKKQDYFFVLATLLNPKSDQNGLVGKMNTGYDIQTNKTGFYTYNPGYFQAHYGGMQYYRPGCSNMGFVIDNDPETDEPYELAKLTPEGLKLAKAFQHHIEKTKYYKEYRLSNKPVPEGVLRDYGNAIRLDFVGYDDCKDILQKHLFETKKYGRLAESAEYVRYLVNNYEIEQYDDPTFRYLLYDCHSPRCENAFKYDTNLRPIVNGWEIEVGRLYFTAGLEIIWKYMLEILTEPMTKEQWIARCKESSSFRCALSKSLKEVLPKCVYSYEERESIISDGRSNSLDHSRSLDNGIRIMLSVFNRFKEREDIDEEKALFNYGTHNESISLTEFFDLVYHYRNGMYGDFIEEILGTYIIDQHYITTYDKLFRGNDGFYYEMVDGLYSWKHDFSFNFQGLRTGNLRRVMRDLNMI